MCPYLNVQVAIVEEEVDPVVAAEGGLGLSDLVVVMGKLEVDAARVNVHVCVEYGAGHGRALDVPAGSTETPRRAPRRLAGLRELPQGEVGRVLLLARLVAGQVALALGQRLAVAERLRHQLGVVVLLRLVKLERVEVHRTVGHITFCCCNFVVQIEQYY